MRLRHPRPARRGQGHPGRPAGRALRHPGDLDRRHLPRQHRQAARRSACRSRQILDAGGYVPDEITNDLVRDRLGAGRRASPASCSTATRAPRPRSTSSTRCSPSAATRSTSSLELTVDRDEVVGRLLKRAATEGRTDDTEDVIRKRQQIYADETAPLVDVYRERGLLVAVDGLGAVDDVDRPARRRASTRRRARLTRDGRRDRPRPDPVQVARPGPAHAPGRRCSSAQTLRALREARRGRASPPASWTRSPSGTIRDAGATPSLPRLRPPAVPRHASASRSTTRSCTASRARGVLADGDLVSIDCGAIVDGWHGDSAISRGRRRRRARRPGRRRAAAGHRAVDVARHRRPAPWASGCTPSAPPSRTTCCAADAAYGIVEEYVGHGIGTEMHQDPQVPNYRVRDKGVRVRSGLCVAIEPMLTRGSAQTRVLADDWTVVTARRLARRALRAHGGRHRRRACGC